MFGLSDRVWRRLRWPLATTLFLAGLYFLTGSLTLHAEGGLSAELTRVLFGVGSWLFCALVIRRAPPEFDRTP